MKNQFRFYRTCKIQDGKLLVCQRCQEIEISIRIPLSSCQLYVEECAIYLLLSLIFANGDGIGDVAQANYDSINNYAL